MTTVEDERTLIASCIPFCGWSFVVKHFFWFYVQTKMTKSAKNEQMGDVCGKAKAATLVTLMLQSKVGALRWSHGSKLQTVFPMIWINMIQLQLV